MSSQIPIGTQVPAASPALVPVVSTGQVKHNGGHRNRYRNRSTNWNKRTFTPMLPNIEALSSNSENKSQDFSKFQKSIHHHVLTTFKSSKDLSKAILEFKDPYSDLKSDRPSLTIIRTENNLEPVPPTSGETAEEKFIREAENADRNEMTKMLFNNELKIFTERERDLTQNLTILWATVMGKCSPALQEEISGEPDYATKSANFYSIWLLQTLQKVTAGVNKTTNRYFSAYYF